MLTGSRYVLSQKDILSYFLEDLPLSDPWNVCIKHDGDPPHKVSSVKQYIRETFQQVIWYGDYDEWP
ncbi:hypothetical protein TNCV_3529751 [Trichonephila clavipes]|uniref:Uncharacterized protein n=1 Tax=Trichonephila clavipes TaxID=2585209 RepID=A0A8X6RHK2_TRICX|nr:hypothetical protein TNCV_3529751 [Trichonephila clavipes]